MAAAIHPDATAVSTGTDVEPKKKHGRRIVAALRNANRLGVLQDGLDREAGPVAFPCRYKGKKGHAYITATATSPALSWTTEKEDIDPVFSIAIADIKEIKKVGGLGWKTKLIVGWATQRDIADGLVVIDREGESKHLTAIALREELFNRLIALGNQMWEAW
jgi:hypothetical protein